MRHLVAESFDRIDHEALLAKVNAAPAVARQLRAWLKAGTLDGDTLFPSEQGTPQGGAISPLLANIALHGLEELVRRRFPDRRVNGEQLYAAILVRYADDFVVLHEKEDVVRGAQAVIAEWLRTMGLELKPSKTRIGHTLREVGREGISVNAVAPGGIETEMNRGYDSEVEAIPIPRLGQPEDVAQAVVFLASQMSNYVTGAVLHVNGGIV